MSLLQLARVHGRIARRQKALWLTSIPLTLFATLLALTSPAHPGTGGLRDLVFVGQLVAIFTGIAYAAAFSDFLTAPGRFGIDELEASTPTSALALRAARMAGTLAVVVAPSVLVLAGLGAAQTAAGHGWSLPQSLAVAATIVAPAALVAMTLSAAAGALLPRPLGRITGVLVWCLLVFSSPLVPLPTVNGTVFNVVGDAVIAGWFGARPLYEPTGPLAFHATASSAALSLALQAVLAATLLTAGSGAARRRR